MRQFAVLDWTVLPHFSDETGVDSFSNNGILLSVPRAALIASINGVSMTLTKWEYCFLRGTTVIVCVPNDVPRTLDHHQALQRRGIAYTDTTWLLIGILGEEGWEMVSAEDGAYFFKRPKA